MKFEDFTEEMICDIMDSANSSLSRLGIPYISCNIHEGKDGCIKLFSSPFNTTPVIYKRIMIEGTACLTEVDSYPGTYDLDFNLNYQLEYFGGGRNGVFLGVLHFRVFDMKKAVKFCGLNLR